MELDEFIQSLNNCGWRSTHDAQHTEIEVLWRKLWPCVAMLSDELEEIRQDMKNLLG
jgi:hypothetical protein